jgi:DNA-binding NtrC family response regulator
VDVRLIAATNRDLSKMVEEGKFREDLYFRLSVVPLTLPPLRARKVDLPVLVQSFLKSFAEDNGKPFREISPDAMQAILQYDWPGNVRELRTAVEHGVVMATGAKIELRDLPAKVRSGLAASPVAVAVGVSAPLLGEERLDLHKVEDRLIEEAMRETNGNVTKAALRLGISRRTLHRRLKESRANS